jgi:UDP-N-acetylmuramate--alanine ligase
MAGERIHLIGIGGTGMSAIARVLVERGNSVSGSDRQMSALAEGLLSAGVQIFIGHRPDNIQGAGLIVRSSAIPDDNVEVVTAQAAGIPVLKRSNFLGKLMADHYPIAVAGSHGKTTTTAMITWVLSALGYDPSFIIGGISKNLKTNAHAGKGPHFVIEADEYDRMFLGLQPQLAVVTNVEHDHPDCFPTFVDFIQAFHDFINCVKPGGLILICTDDPEATRLGIEAAQRGQQVLSYGLLSDRLDFKGCNLTLNDLGGFTYTALDRRSKPEIVQPIELRVPGEHNVLNSLAAFGVARLLDLPAEATAQALNAFSGTGRRFDLRGEAAGVVIIDDYAHHPTEIRATLAAARKHYANRRIWAVWQPHTFSRTQALFTEFTSAFDHADFVLVSEVYAARETPPQSGFSSRQLVERMKHPVVHYVTDLEQAESYLLEHLKPGDVLLVLSAGDADQLSAALLAKLGARQVGEPK